MTHKKLSEIRDELADNHAETYFELNSDLEEEEINARDGIIYDFKRGFDAGVAEMKQRAQVLVEALELINKECSDMDDYRIETDWNTKAKATIEAYKAGLK